MTFEQQAQARHNGFGPVGEIAMCVFTLPSWRRRRSGGELRLATVSMYMAIKSAQIYNKIKQTIHIYMATYYAKKHVNQVSKP